MASGTVISLILLGYFLRTTKQLNRHHEPKTNIYALQGKRGYVLKEINGGTMGEIKVGNELWAARSLHDGVINRGTLVEVIAVSGCHCVVSIVK